MPKPLISICICTYRRPAVAETIASLGQMILPDSCTVEIVVADNDIEPSARDYVEAAATEISIPVRYCHAPKQNISIARNACLDAAKGDWVGFIDDDETVSEGWLKAMLDATQQGQTDMAFGPVWARYPEGTEAWLVDADFHSTQTLEDQDLITGYSGNSFFNVKHPAIAGRRFNLDRGRTGGEDTEFFHECFRAGATLRYVPDAAASEPVAPNRLSLAWLSKTRFQAGVTYGKVVTYRGSALRNSLALLPVVAKAAVLFAKAAIPFRTRASARKDYVRALFHLGTAQAFFSSKVTELYGLETNAAPTAKSAS